MQQIVIGIIGSLFAITLILISVFILNRWAMSGSMSFMRGKHIKVIDRIILDKTSSIILFELLGSAYLITVTHENTTFIEKIPISDLEIKDNEKKEMNFKNVFENIYKRNEKARMDQREDDSSESNDILSDMLKSINNDINRLKKK